MPILVSKYFPLRLRVCLESLSPSVSLRPNEPSLNAEDRKRFGYAVRSAPSAFKGTEPNVLVILYVGRPLVFKRISSLSRVSLALLTGTYLVSLFTISKPFTYAFPGPIVASNLSFASDSDRPFTVLVDVSSG